MKMSRYFVLFGLLLPFFSEAAEMSSASLIKELQGVYKHRFMSGNILYGGDETWPAEDIIEIVPFDDSHIYIRAHLEYDNGNLCSIWGIAEYEDGAFVYHESEKLGDGGLSCTLKVSATEKQLVLTDSATNDHSSCKLHCGIRGSLNYNIERSSKRSIRYLERLKSSRQYLEAVDEFKKTQSPTQRSSGTPQERGAP